jgi:hypothetical protein
MCATPGVLRSLASWLELSVAENPFSTFPKRWLVRMPRLATVRPTDAPVFSVTM